MFEYRLYFQRTLSRGKYAGEGKGPLVHWGWLKKLPAVIPGRQCSNPADLVAEPLMGPLTCLCSSEPA